MITVDDFGINEQANKLIEKTIKTKIVTHVSVMTNMPGSIQAFEIIKRSRGVEYGLHLNLTQPFGGLVHLENKIREQIKLLRKIAPITFINSHHHVHFIPWIANIVIKLAKQYRIQYIRRPQKIWFPPAGKSRIIKSLAIQIAGTLVNLRGLKSSDYFIDLDWINETYRLEILRKLPKNVEISCHPLIFHKGFTQPTLQWLIENKNKLNFR